MNQGSPHVYRHEATNPLWCQKFKKSLQITRFGKPILILFIEALNVSCFVQQQVTVVSKQLLIRIYRQPAVQRLQLRFFVNQLNPTQGKKQFINHQISKQLQFLYDSSGIQQLLIAVNSIKCKELIL